MSDSLDFLVEIMRKLRDPKTGCPWDIKQNFETLIPCTLEETYEVVEAIEAGDKEHLCEELGDLLLQIVFFAQLAAEENSFTFDDIARKEAEKMIERHPHVFGDRQDVITAQDVLKNWEADKAAKRALESDPASSGTPSALDGITTSLPALTRSMKLMKRAARVGFDWPDTASVLGKLHEEMGELEAEIDKGADKAALTDELGDVLMAVVNLARHLDIDPETALRGANRKFERRFKGMEEAFLVDGHEISSQPLAAMEAKWQEIKKQEK